MVCFQGLQESREVRDESVVSESVIFERVIIESVMVESMIMFCWDNTDQ